MSGTFEDSPTGKLWDQNHRHNNHLMAQGYTDVLVLIHDRPRNGFKRLEIRSHAVKGSNWESREPRFSHISRTGICPFPPYPNYYTKHSSWLKLKVFPNCIDTLFPILLRPKKNLQTLPDFTTPFFPLTPLSLCSFRLSLKGSLHRWLRRDEKRP